ncbi:hypothetical protein PPL_05886 [Heterostelium album PN500]|uniref:t-SNARE coiled-coil homology domain-containing protein n=1 Tax=Heterostelium pallidum (strain ATCC 26659 / Pp 5 / PN500) TaxID=670386 RepID=D3BBL7_HETP5|nr:hypothetical protein PPL_05886 [Heterostelium album PN500]EFA81050.1 hypothetical protein PPL_05886 [Heterostelium album PN500]|eukprot:XP_020433168.1 hypothetical protein PPL_05886 [Heterostelium album PN500]
MADTLAEFEQEFRSLADEIDRGTKEIQRAVGKKQQFDVRAKAELLDGRLKRAKDVLKSYRREYRELEKKDQAEYATKATQFEEIIKTIENDLRWAEKQNEGGSTPSGGAETSTPQDDYNQTMIQAKNIQKKDIEAVTRMQQEAIQITQVGTATLEEMAIQTEQMKRIDKHLDEVDSNLKLATRQMRAFARKMATDKLIMGLVLLIVLAIIFVIVWSIVKPSKSTDSVRDRVTTGGGTTGTSTTS